jgi:hypothetical protein
MRGAANNKTINKTRFIVNEKRMAKLLKACQGRPCQIHLRMVFLWAHPAGGDGRAGPRVCVLGNTF